jgi:DNA polymerase-3 subunit epsilon
MARDGLSPWPGQLGRRDTSAGVGVECCFAKTVTPMRHPKVNNCFVAVDVETANSDMASICQVGVVAFGNGEVVDSWVTLVDPQDRFDDINISIHGIDRSDVQGAPRFPDIEARLRESFAECVVVSHMPFDRIAIGKACDKYKLPSIECTWLDTARVTRRAWPQFRCRGYGLASVAAWCEIQYDAHDAEEDARAAGLVLLRAISDSGLGVEEWVVRAIQPIG